MSREIKFRAWYDKSQTWVYFTIKVIRNSKGKHWTDLAKKVYSEISIDGGKFYEYTGLTDKNGTEIYEGDLLVVPKFAIDYPYGVSIPDIFHMEEMYSLEPDDIEVIGNVYDNPELLESSP